MIITSFIGGFKLCLIKNSPILRLNQKYQIPQRNTHRYIWFVLLINTAANAVGNLEIEDVTEYENNIKKKNVWLILSVYETI